MTGAAPFKDGIPKGLGIKVAQPARPPAPPPPPDLRPGDVEIGTLDTGGVIGLDLVKVINGRLLIQGVSGAGKSWTLRRLLEQTHSRIPQVIVDPEGEFRSLADCFGHLHVRAELLDEAALASAAARAREHRLSLLLDLSELGASGQMKAFAAFFAALIEAPQEHWRPVLVAIDEAHLFAPFGGQVAVATSVRKAAIDALVDVMGRGRKRGIVSVLATRRLARLSKSVASEVQNFMVGLNTLDLDIKRAAETIGWETRKAFDRLPLLEPGDFVAVGPAFSRSPAVLRVGPVETEHLGSAPALDAEPVTIDPEQAAALLNIDALIEESAEAADLLEESAQLPGLRAVRGFLRDPAALAACKIWSALVPLAPDGARIVDLPKHLVLSEVEVSEGLALLDGFGAIEFDGDDAGAVRIARGMRP